MPVRSIFLWVPYCDTDDVRGRDIYEYPKNQW